MADPHRALGRFFDGELPDSEVDGFRAHLATCKRCQTELEELMQLDVLGTRHLQLQGLKVPKVVQLKPAPRPQWLKWGGVGLALAATVALVVSARLWRGPSEELWQPAGPDVRLAEARSSYPKAAQWHRQSVPLGPESGSERSLSEVSKVGDDPLAVASFLLARNDPGLVRQALEHLAQIRSPDESSDSERAMAYLVRGDPEAADFEEALRYAEMALRRNPKHGPALWNKALALRGLGLNLLAAKTFDQVAQLGEQGWATEAPTKAEQLRSQTAHVRETWNAAKDAAEALVKGGSTLPDEALNAPIARRLFYDAVRTRSSSADVVALLPLAEQMDQRSGGTFLQEYVRKIANRDFRVRGPEAAKFRRLAVDHETSLIQELSHSPEDDIALGALTWSPTAVLSQEELQALQTHVEKVGDPWFQALLAMKRAGREERSDLQAASKLLEDAIPKADALRLQYRSLQMRVSLITYRLRASDLNQARAEAVAAWKAAEVARDWGMQRQIIQLEAQLARLRKDYPVAKAYLGEAIERNREDHVPSEELFNRQQLAMLEVENLNMDAAREQMDAAIATGQAIDYIGAGVLADVTRKRASALDRQVMDKFRANLSQAPANERALGKEAIGRWTIEVNPAEGRKLLQDLIQEIGRPSDPDGHEARARAFASSALMMDAAKRNDFAAVLSLFSEEAGGVPFPATCAVALNLDAERGAVVVRGPTGQVEGAYDGDRKDPLPRTLAGFVPEWLVAKLKGCSQVKVVARPPLFGRLGALPDSIAWSYLLLDRSAAKVPTGAPQPGPHLVVQSPSQSKLATRLGLKPPPALITSLSPPPGVAVIEGTEATPERILPALETSADVDLIMHSMLDPHSGEAFLVAAEGVSGDTVTAEQIRELKLTKHPTVMLSACRAAHTAPVLYEARSIPAAFLLAGAHAVFAADEEVPADEGPRFFEAIRGRIHEGTPPAIALHEVRQAWLAEGKVTKWALGVLLFE